MSVCVRWRPTDSKAAERAPNGAERNPNGADWECTSSAPLPFCFALAVFRSWVNAIVIGTNVARRGSVRIPLLQLYANRHASDKGKLTSLQNSVEPALDVFRCASELSVESTRKLSGTHSAAFRNGPPTNGSPGGVPDRSFRTFHRDAHPSCSYLIAPVEISVDRPIMDLRQLRIGVCEPLVRRHRNRH